MKTFVIFVVLLLAGCIALLVFAPYYAINTYRAQIIEEISERTGYHIEVNGDIGIKTLPSLQLTLPAFVVHTRNNDGTPNEKILEAKGAELKLDTIKAALYREILIEHVTLDTPHLTLRQQQDGTWNPVTAGGNTGEAPTNIESSGVKGDKGVTIDDVSLESVSVTHASADIFPAAGKHVQLKRLSFETGYTMRPDFHAFSVTADDIIIGKDATGPVAVSGQYMIEGPAVILKETTLRYKEHQFSGAITLNTAAKPIAVTADISAPHINIPLLAGNTHAAPAAVTGDTPGVEDNASAETTFSVPDFSVIALNASVKTQRLTVKDGADIAPAAFTLANKNNALTADIKEAGIAGGTVSGVVRIRDNNGIPALGLTLAAQGLRPDAIPPALLPEKPPLTGTVGMNADVTASGDRASALLNSLSGTWAFTVKDGTVAENNFTRMLTTGKDVISALRGKGDINFAEAIQQKTNKDGRALVFRTAKAGFTITNGVMSTDNLAIDGEIVDVSGAGALDLPKKNIDMRFTAALPSVKHSSDSAKYVPVRVSGPFNKPKITPEFSVGIGEALKDPEAAKALIKDIVNDSNALKDKAGKALRQLRDNFLGNGGDDENAGGASGGLPGIFGR